MIGLLAENHRPGGIGPPEPPESPSVQARGGRI